MKLNIPNHSKNSRHPFFCVVFLLGVMVSLLSLGSVRIYGIYLEQRLAACGGRIEKEEDQYAMMEEYNASLLSPSRIYNYAKSELHMITASKIETIKLLSDSYGGNAGGIIPAGKNVANEPGGLGRILVGTANAKE